MKTVLSAGCQEYVLTHTHTQHAHRPLPPKVFSNQSNVSFDYSGTRLPSWMHVAANWCIKVNLPQWRWQAGPSLSALCRLLCLCLCCKDLFWLFGLQKSLTIGFFTFFQVLFWKSFYTLEILSRYCMNIKKSSKCDCVVGHIYLQWRISYVWILDYLNLCIH